MLVFGHFGDLKVDKFDFLSQLVEENVFRFDVPMAAAFFVKICDDVQELAENGSDQGFIDSFVLFHLLLDELAQVGELTVFQN